MTKLKLEPKKCLICGSLINLKLRRDTERKKLCSNDCRYRYLAAKNKNLSPEINQKKAHRKENHPLWQGGSVKKECLICKREFFITRHKYNSGLGKYCSRKCMGISFMGAKRAKTAILICPICNKTFNRFIREVRQNERRHRRNICSPGCARIGALQATPKKNTSIEVRMKCLLEKNRISFKRNIILFGATIPDFLLEDKIAIYCDGKYWHSIPKVRERDEKINQLLTGRNYQVLRVGEDDINKNLPYCLFLIRQCQQQAKTK